MKTPNKLYKYRTLNVNSLRMLSEAEVYYANPVSFNDPLDCDPTIDLDTSLQVLEKLSVRLITESASKEKAIERVNHHRYMSTEYGDYKNDSNVKDYYMQMLASDIKKSIVSEFGKKGVFSLASNWHCPLMWSHYGDEHRGFCIEYDATDNEFQNLCKVEYGGKRGISISDIAAWKTKNNKKSRNIVFETFFQSKARKWKYEGEWRDISETHGARGSPAKIKSIYFGLRCDSSVRTTVVKLLAGSNIKFYDVHPNGNSFDFTRRLIDKDEIEYFGVRTSAAFAYRDFIVKGGK